MRQRQARQGCVEDLEKERLHNLMSRACTLLYVYLGGKDACDRAR